ncbi:MAG: TIGR03986 family CRISPR-associated RAMP protein [Candidatus Omnitrophota bacterium]|jgi:CRISPR-associated protein (TIGR03986 family)|nr:MAG: TIGR03986 family CRISPR-associated RAMP protein [Candidatus Omnitrophota bacterium]
MASGRIIELRETYGFIIADEGGLRTFFHFNDVEETMKSELSEKMPVQFDPVQGQDSKPKAINVRPFEQTQSSSRRQSYADPSLIQPPYHFVPVPTNSDGTVRAIVDEPVFHDGTPKILDNDKKETRISGELQCTLTALTPLLVGNDQYEVKYIKGATKINDQQMQLPDKWGIPYPVSIDKKVLEPLRLDDEDKRVLISGSSLKGMLRKSLGALLGAPMERVGERKYTYRPNLGFPEHNIRYECRPAIIQKENNKIYAKLLYSNVLVYFVRNDAYEILGSPKAKQKFENVKIDNIEIKRGRYIRNIDKELSKRIEKRDGKKANLNHICFIYKGGIDGKGLLAKAFSPTSSVYKYVMIKLEDWNNCKNEPPLEIEEEVYEKYIESQNQLKDDQSGHLRSEHPLRKKFPDSEQENNQEREYTLQHLQSSIEKNTDMEENQLIYVEVELENNDPKRIVSLGHHFYYRWAYRDSVWEKNGRWRSVLEPAKDEKIVAEKLCPTKLTGPRLLFGYVTETKNNGTLQIEKGPFDKLAGRLAFNIAVEQIETQPRQRFVNEDQKSIVSLKVLGMPRPSSVEFYLNQENRYQRNDGNRLITYGDLHDDHLTGELNGRKFYLHQPDAATDISCYQTTDKEIITGDQATFARFISTPKTKFRFTFRFRDLRPWELGAVLFALNPNYIQDIQSEFPKPWTSLHNYLDNRPWNETNEQYPMFALKLGHGRPLGLGSLKIEIDRLLTINSKQGLDPVENHEEWKNNFLKPFAGKLKNEGGVAFDPVLCQWLKIHQYYGRKRCKYPEKKGKIFEYHTEIRREHAKARRMYRTQVTDRSYDFEHKILQELPD